MNYDGVTYHQKNGGDFSFADSTITTNKRSSHHLGGPLSNVSLFDTHSGWSEYGWYQDFCATGDGVQGLTAVASPIEAVSKRHIRLINGGAIDIVGGYWTWTAGHPKGPSFSISGLQNTGGINFGPGLVDTNPNCSYLFYAGSQNHNLPFRFFAELSAPAGRGLFAKAVFPATGSYSQDAVYGDVVLKAPDGKSNVGFGSFRVGVPASATAAGRPGYWASDATHVYTYTGNGTTHSWVRATAAAW